MLRRTWISTLALMAGLVNLPVFAAPDHMVWDSLLKKHVVSVRGGLSTQVDYSGMAADKTQLKQYLASTTLVSRATFDSWSKPEQLAFLLNAYNAWTVDLVLTKYPDLKSIKELGSLIQSPWKKPFVQLLGETRSLDDVEHKLIRGSGRYNDPRVHFAANCASIGCPALRAEAFTAERLEAQLEDAAKTFLSDKTRNRFEGGKFKVSSIFKWYREDFEKGWRGASGLGQFMALYKAPLGLDEAQTKASAAGGIDFDFLDYDWNLNAKVGK